MRVLCCGSRSWTDFDAIYARLDYLRPLCPTIVHGMARGADVGADWAAHRLGFPVEHHVAEWDKHGKQAGFLRNVAMLESGIDLVIAFHDGVSPGTAHTIREAERRGIPTEVILPSVSSCA